MNYIVVNRNYKEFIDYYNTSINFKIKSADKRYVIFELSPKTTYVEVNGKYTENILKKETDNIQVEFNCERGKITVKETYNKNWVAYLNGIEIGTNPTNHGFIEIENGRITGKCNLELAFKEQIYYILSVIVSIVAWILVTAFIAYKIIRDRQMFI